MNFVIKTSIYLTVFLVPLFWSPWTFENFEFSKQYVLLFLVMLGVFAFVAKMVLVERELHFKKNPLNLPLFLFLVVALFSTVFSADTWSSVFGYYGRFSDGFLGLLGAVGLYLLVINTIQKPASLVRLFLLSSVVAVLLGYLLLFGVLQANLVDFNTIAQSLGEFSVFLAFLVSFLAFLSLRREIKPLPFLGNLILLFSSVGILLLVDIVQAWIILLVGLSVVVFLGLFWSFLVGESMRLRRLWLPLVLLLLTVIFLFSSTKILFTLSGALGEVKVPQESMLSQEASWNIAFGTLTESTKNLVLGSGPGTFALDFSKHKPANLNQTSLWQTRFDRPGNHFSEVLSTTGILGFLLYLSLVFWFLLISLIFLKNKKNIPFVLGVMVLFAAQLVYYQTTMLQVMFWLFLAFGVVSFELSHREFRFSLRRFSEFKVASKALLLLLLFFVTSTFFFGARFFAADINYVAAQNTLSLNPAGKIERALKAVHLNPWQAEYRIFVSRLYLDRALGELRKSEDSRNQEQISKDVQYAIAFSRGDTLECQNPRPTLPGQSSGGQANDKCQKITGATELSPNRVASWETLGAVYRDITFANGALEWSIHSFKRAISLEPANPVLYTELGKLYIMNEEFSQAREYLKKAKELKGDYLKSGVQLALLREKEGRSEAALAELQKLSLRYPLSVDGNFQLGRLLYNTGELQQAISQFEQVLKIAPNHSNALFALGIALESQGKIEEAKIQLKKALQLNPGNVILQQKLQALEG